MHYCARSKRRIPRVVAETVPKKEDLAVTVDEKENKENAKATQQNCSRKSNRIVRIGEKLIVNE
jgi:hypothetical protein